MKVVAVALLLASLAHAGEIVDGVRKHIDGFRTDEDRRRFRLVLPDAAPEAPAVSVLTMDYRIGHYSVAEGQLRFAPGEGDVLVERVEIGSYLPGFRTWTPRGIGVRIERARLARTRYDALVRRILVVREARLEGDGFGMGWGPTTSDGRFRMRLEAEELSFEVETSFPVPHGLLGAIGEPERALFWRSLADVAIDGLAFERVDATGPVAERLLKELEGCSDWRARFRIRILGALGEKKAVPVLEKMGGEESPVGYEAAIALKQIETLQLEDPVPTLGALLDYPDPIVREWAHAVLRERYATVYRDQLVALFDRSGVEGKLLAIDSLAEFAPADLSLARRGLADGSARVRVEAGLRLLDAGHVEGLEEVFLAAAADKGLTNREEFWARTGAVDGLPFLPGGGERTRKALTRILADEADDVIVRGAAALSLGRLGDPAAIPALLEVFRSPVPEAPVYLQEPPAGWDEEMEAEFRSVETYLQRDDVRSDAARALGLLRAKEAVAPLMGYLAREPTDHDHNLRATIALSLAQIAAPQARPILEQLEDREMRTYCLDLMDALNAADTLDALLAFCEKHPKHELTFVLRTLSKLASPEELKALAKKHPKIAPILEKASEE